MGKPILLLRLEGALQSWGLAARWDVRDTSYEPTKSGVIGLLGAALGYPRGDARLERLDGSLCFGVRVEHPGRKITDYQTITDYLPTAAGAYKMSGSKTASTLEAARRNGTPATIISPRDYLEDAAFLVALEAREGGEEELEAAVHAVQHPRWPLFLGRRACPPSRPIFDSFSHQYVGLQDALERHPWEWLGALGKEGEAIDNRGRAFRGGTLEAWIETDDPLESGAVARQDSLRLNAARLYEFRFTRRLPPITPPLPEPPVSPEVTHDALSLATSA